MDPRVGSVLRGKIVFTTETHPAIRFSTERDTPSLPSSSSPLSLSLYIYIELKIWKLFANLLAGRLLTFPSFILVRREEILTENKGKFVTRNALFFRKYISSYYLRDCKKMAITMWIFRNNLLAIHMIMKNQEDTSIYFITFAARRFDYYVDLKFWNDGYKVFLPIRIFLKCWRRRNEIKKQSGIDRSRSWKSCRSNPTLDRDLSRLVRGGLMLSMTGMWANNNISLTWCRLPSL